MKLCPMCSAECESSSTACGCGYEFDAIIKPPSISTALPSVKLPWPFILGGAGLGSFIGFLLRPSIPFVGQLPFSAVISRGSDFQGLDLVLKGVAETSFNFLVVGTIVGALVGVGIGHLIKRKATQ